MKGRRWHRSLAAVFAAVLMVTTGCGGGAKETAESVITKSQAYYKDAKSASATLEMETLLGSVNVRMTVDDAQNASMTTSILGMEMGEYTIKEGDKYIQYEGMDTEWTKSEVTDSAVADMLEGIRMMNLPAELDPKRLTYEVKEDHLLSAELDAKALESVSSLSEMLSELNINALNEGDKIKLNAVYDKADCHLKTLTLTLPKNETGKELKIVIKDVIVKGVEKVVLPEAAKAAK